MLSPYRADLHSTIRYVCLAWSYTVCPQGFDVLQEIPVEEDVNKKMIVFKPLKSNIDIDEDLLKTKKVVVMTVSDVDESKNRIIINEWKNHESIEESWINRRIMNQ